MTPQGSDFRELTEDFLSRGNRLYVHYTAPAPARSNGAWRVKRCGAILLTLPIKPVDLAQISD
jgi:hypothetical protein